MKIAIKANPNRGKEIISLLESLGGINSKNWKGDADSDTYYIDKDNKIQYYLAPAGYKVYTLEEFEKEFPFKIGDKVIKKNGGKIGIIIKRYNPYMWGEMLPHDILYMIQFNDDPIPHRYSVEELKPYKEMKEERNITLTLDKAKEWYSKGGELKEIALQAFSKKELNPLPRSWEEFYEQYKFKSNLNACLNAIRFNFIIKYENKFRAFVKLQYLRDCWRQGWEPDDWNNGYCIVKHPEKYVVMKFGFTSFFSFPTKETAEEFLKCFRDLIEQAGDLI